MLVTTHASHLARQRHTKSRSNPQCTRVRVGTSPAWGPNMKSLRQLGCVACAALLFFGVGCGGATESNEAPSGAAPGTETNDRPAAIANLTLKDECDGVKGLTGQSILDKLEVPTGAVFRRYPGPASYPDPATSTPATVRVRYEGADARCTPAGHPSNRDMNPAIVPARVTVVVKVDFKTDDGLFDEHVEGELTSDVGSNQVRLSAVIPVVELRGKYRETATKDAVPEGKPVTLLGYFHKGDKEKSGGDVVHGDDTFGAFTYRW